MIKRIHNNQELMNNIDHVRIHKCYSFKQLQEVTNISSGQLCNAINCKTTLSIEKLFQVLDTLEINLCLEVNEKKFDW